MERNNKEYSEGAEGKLGWHRVCLNTIVRATKELESARLRILPMGSRVNVVEISGRRVRIDQPIDGWCSIESSNGDLILSPAEESDAADKSFEHEETYMTARAQQLANELTELKALREQVRAQKLVEEEVGKTNEAAIKLEENVQELEAQVQSKKAYDELIAEKRSQIENLKQITEAKKAESLAVKSELYSLCAPEDGKRRLPSSVNSHSTNLLNGDVVLINAEIGLGIVRYVGVVEWSSEVYMGVELGEPIGNTNGTQGSRKYFTVQDNHGLFLPLSQVSKKIPAENLLQKLHLLVSNDKTASSAQE